MYVCTTGPFESILLDVYLAEEASVPFLMALAHPTANANYERQALGREGPVCWSRRKRTKRFPQRNNFLDVNDINSKLSTNFTSPIVETLLTHRSIMIMCASESSGDGHCPTEKKSGDKRYTAPARATTRTIASGKSPIMDGFIVPYVKNWECT